MSAVVELSSRRKPEPVPPATGTVAPFDIILRLPDVAARVGLSRATIYRRMRVKAFPESVGLGGQSIGWRESDINAWIASRRKGGAA